MRLFVVVASFLVAVAAREVKHNEPSFTFEDDRGQSCTYYGPFGGGGGSGFNDMMFANGPIRCITIRHGSAIDAIQITYTSSGPWRGGHGGTESFFCLQPDHIITHVFGTTSALVYAMTFQTDRGMSYGPFGGRGSFPYSVVDPRGLNYIFGGSGRALDRIGFAFCD